MSEELVESEAELEVGWDLGREWEQEGEQGSEWEGEQGGEWDLEWDLEWEWEQKRGGSSAVGITGRLGIGIESKELESTGNGNTVVWGSNPRGDMSLAASITLGWDLVWDLVVSVVDRDWDAWWLVIVVKKKWKPLHSDNTQTERQDDIMVIQKER